MLSMRIPPTLSPERASQTLKDMLEKVRLPLSSKACALTSTLKLIKTFFIYLFFFLLFFLYSSKIQQPIYGAKITCTPDKSAPGWAAPEMKDWLLTSVNDASNTYFGKPACYIGEGGSIPFMGMLGEMFPEAQFVITGVLGPKSNAHGPNGNPPPFPFPIKSIRDGF
jgi:hypothetical protein